MARRKEQQEVLSPETEARQRLAKRAYRLSLLGLIPGLGLVLGPVAFVMGALLRRSCLRDPQFNLWGPVLASIWFGVAVTACNWIGFTLMYLGLRSAGIL